MLLEQQPHRAGTRLGLPVLDRVGQLLAGEALDPAQHLARLAVQALQQRGPEPLDQLLRGHRPDPRDPLQDPGDRLVVGRLDGHQAADPEPLAVLGVALTDAARPDPIADVQVADRPDQDLVGPAPAAARRRHRVEHREALVVAAEPHADDLDVERLLLVLREHAGTVPRGSGGSGHRARITVRPSIACGPRLRDVPELFGRSRTQARFWVRAPVARRASDPGVWED